MASQSSAQAKLEPPGAGLPAYELAWLRPGFRFICVVLPQGSALELFKSEGKRVLSLAQTVSAEQGAVPVLIDRVIGIEDSAGAGLSLWFSIICGSSMKASH